MTIPSFASVDTGVDMTVAVKGGGGQATRVLPEGMAFARLVEYVELGDHIKEFDGKPKAPAPQMRLGFALYNIVNGKGEVVREYQNPDGTPYIMRTIDMANSQNEKAKTFKLFKRMNYLGTAKQFNHLLGVGFIVNIVNKKSKAGKEYSSIDLENIASPFDPMGNEYPIPVPEVNLYRCLIWTKPSVDMWASLTKYQQLDAMKAVNWEGSPIATLLAQNGIALPEPDTDDADTPADAPDAAPAVSAPPAAMPPAAPQSTAAASPPAAVPSAPPAAPMPPAAPAAPAIAIAPPPAV